MSRAFLIWHARARWDSARARVAGFDVDSRWQHVARLVIAWLAAPANAAAARELRNQVAKDIDDPDALQTLLQWVDADLDLGRAVPVFLLQPAPTPHHIKMLLDRVGAGSESSDLLADDLQSYPVAEELASLVTVDDLAETTGFLAELDGPRLVAYAAEHPVEGREALAAYVAAISYTGYQEYRSRSLWMLLGRVLQHPEKEWVQDALEILMAAVFAGGVDFEMTLPVTALALQAQSLPAAAAQFVEIAAQAQHEGKATQRRQQNDRWGVHKQMLLAIAEVACRLLPAWTGPAPLDLLQLALDLGRSGFAGYQVSACLALSGDGSRMPGGQQPACRARPSPGSQRGSECAGWRVLCAPDGPRRGHAPALVAAY